MSWWALDLGTRNTALARWDADAGVPRLVRLPRLARDEDPLGAGPEAVVPSAIEVAPQTGWPSVLARFPPFRDALTWGREGFVGRQAVERNATWPGPAYVASFKDALLRAPLRPVAKASGRTWSAREVARIYLRELLAEAQRVTLARPRRLVVTSPVDAYEPYRAEVGALLEGLGAQALRWVDEPIAAAVGYGVSLTRPRTVLVVDWGAGSLDVVLVALDAHGVQEGRAEVLAKVGRPLGGDRVDAWLLDASLRRAGGRPPTDRFLERWLLEEARRVKETLYLRDQEPFLLVPPEGHRAAGAPIAPVEWSREALRELLAEHGAGRALAGTVDEVLRDGPEPDEVLLVGGSTLLPGVRDALADRFGADRVRAWHPFGAVALGACQLAGTGFAPEDHVVHDYAIVVHDPDTGARGHAVVVPAGTRFPTAPDLWRDRLVPTCAHGQPEHVFKLVVAEIGRRREETPFTWDAGGMPRRPDGEAVVVPLNESDPVLGRLDPPHWPDDPGPRLEVAFGVDADRWLVATVRDLRTGQMLLERRPVVRLL